jgi:acyl-coenzyme A synthetase/AMP-(fatty) acid ligase
MIADQGKATMTINAAAVLLARGEPDDVALACGDERVTYAELRAAVARAAGDWQQRGLEPGDRVAIKLPDGVPWVTAFLGAIWAGGVAVGVNPRLGAAEWETILSDARFRWILGESRDGTLATWHDRFVTLDEWTRAQGKVEPAAPHPHDEAAPAFWGHSSGTSGKPKAVVHPQRFAQHCWRVAAEILDVGPADRLFATSKLFFAYPQANSLFSGLALGATVVLESDWPTPAKVTAIVERERPTVFLTVPSMYRALLKDGYAPRFRDRGIRVCVSAGEALPANLRAEWRRQADLPIVDGYGASETLCLVLVDATEGRGFVPAPGVDIRALEADPARPTRVAIRAPTLSLGYFERPDAQAEYFRDGAFCPADLFLRSEGGTWRFGGREDALVKVRGRWVDLVALEERLAGASAAIAEGAAVSVRDADGVGAIAFYYALREGADPESAAAALAGVTGALPPYQRPCSLRAMPALPRTATGKLLRRKLAELHPAE